MATLATKHELTQQIFTKSMTVQVWKPENERVGRHFVYTTRYVEFFLRLLFELKDRAGLDALGRQIRKKPGKFFKHGRLWHETCMTHLKVSPFLNHLGYVNNRCSSFFVLTPFSRKSFQIQSSRTSHMIYSFLTQVAWKPGRIRRRQNHQ